MASSYVSDLIKSISSNFAPMEAFDKTMSFEDYAKPQMAVFNEWDKNVLRPEFDRFTLNPFKESYGNASAANYGNLMGNAGKNFTRQTDRITQQGYTDPLERAKAEYTNMIEQGYRKRMGNYYTGPDAFTNY